MRGQIAEGGRGNGPEPLEHTPEAGAESARELVRQLIENEQFSQADIARQSGVGATTLSRYLKGTYNGNNGAVEGKLAAWLAALQDRRESPATFGREWVETPTASKIITALTYCHVTADFGVIFGGAGVGKTRTAIHYQANRPNVWLVTMSPVTATPTLALGEVLMALGESTRVLTGAQMLRQVVEGVRGRGGLLVVDEAQHLSVASVEALRTIHDLSGVGLVFVGNDYVYDRLSGGRRQATFAQIFSRIGKTLRIRKPTQGDVDVLAAADGITDKAVIRKLREVGATRSALRGVDKVLKLARTLAHGMGQNLAESHVAIAWNDMGGA